MSLRAKRAQLRKLGIAAGDIGSLNDTELDSMIAAETRRRAEMYTTFARAAQVSTFVQLGVQVLAGDGNVYSIGEHDPYGKSNSSAVLGALGGAEARVNARTGPIYAISGSVPVAIARAAGRATAVGMVAFADGTAHSSVVRSTRNVLDAQVEATRFNQLARGAAAAPGAEMSGDPMDRLRKLLELLDAGLLTEQEYEARRLTIVDSL
jgi:hypothetical protein